MPLDFICLDFQHSALFFFFFVFVVRKSSVSEGIFRIWEGALLKQRVTDSHCLGKKEMIILYIQNVIMFQNNGIGKSIIQVHMLQFIAK